MVETLILTGSIRKNKDYSGKIMEDVMDAIGKRKVFQILQTSKH